MLRSDSGLFKRCVRYQFGHTEIGRKCVRQTTSSCQYDLWENTLRIVVRCAVASVPTAGLITQTILVTTIDGYASSSRRTVACKLTFWNLGFSPSI
jgi:hypothetical protein